MASPLGPGQRPADEPCRQCGQAVLLESIDGPAAARDADPAEIRVCTNPVCVTNSPNGTTSDVP